MTGPRERILQATVEAIEADGIEHATVRDITERAGVNVAAVSYYFGGKDALLAEALEGTLRESFEHPLRDFDAAIARGTAPGAALVALLADQIRDSRRWPGIARAHLFSPAGDVVTERATAFLDALAQRVAAAGWKPAATEGAGWKPAATEGAGWKHGATQGAGGKAAATEGAGWKPGATEGAGGKAAAMEARLGLAQLWAAVVLGAVAPRFVDGTSRLDLSQPKHRERYVKALVRAHLPGLLPEK